jgi:hypothetical protein
MQKHVTALGVLYIALESLGLLAAIIVFWAVVGGGLISGDEEAIAITAIVGTTIAGFLIITSLPGIIGGIGLLKHRPWARILVLILGFLNLLFVPFGTILGIYTIWVLLKDDTAKLFQSASAS